MIFFFVASLLSSLLIVCSIIERTVVQDNNGGGDHNNFNPPIEETTSLGNNNGAEPRSNPQINQLTPSLGNSSEADNVSDEAKSSSSSNRPACAACKHQRKRCAKDCVMAPYFPAARENEFQAALKVFGIKNMSKILTKLKPEERKQAVESFVWEGNAWVNNPIEGPLGVLKRLWGENWLMKVSLESYRHCMIPLQLRGFNQTFNNNNINNNKVTVAAFNGEGGSSNVYGEGNMGVLNSRMRSYASLLREEEPISNWMTNGAAIPQYATQGRGGGVQIGQQYTNLQGEVPESNGNPLYATSHDQQLRAFDARGEENGLNVMVGFHNGQQNLAQNPAEIRNQIGGVGLVNTSPVSQQGVVSYNNPITQEGQQQLVVNQGRVSYGAVEADPLNVGPRRDMADYNINVQGQGHERSQSLDTFFMQRQTTNTTQNLSNIQDQMYEGNGSGLYFDHK